MPLCAQEEEKEEKKPKKVVRKPACAGSWYPANPDKLKADINGYLGKVLPAAFTKLNKNKIFWMILPHAGYRYSGRCAAYGFAAIRGRNFKRVIILAPSHYAGFRGISVSKATHYKTPLGEIELDRAVCKKLLEESEELFTNSPEADAREHAIEMELPFLQCVLEDFKLVPLIVSSMKREDYQKAGRIISRFVDKQTLVIASSDFTHYGERFGFTPFAGETNLRKAIKKLDDGAIEQILKGDPDGFLKYKVRTDITVCGYRPIAILFHMLPEYAQGHLLDYYMSGDLPESRGYDNSVSYATIVFTEEPPRLETPITKEEQITLLQLARDTLKLYLSQGKKPNPKSGKYKLTPRLKKEFGVFVTLHKGDNLRGCIGRIFKPQPLYQGVIENTINSAVRDHRFPPMTIKEEPEVTIEISVLSPMKEIDIPEEITVGVHGVYMVKGGRSAVFLPQVAPEQGWNRLELLEHLCRKAGLERDAWKKGAQFFVFTAQVFGEEE